MSSNMETPGVLSVLGLSSGERDLLVDYYSKSRPDLNIDLLSLIFNDKLLMVLDAYAGQVVKFPTRVQIEKLVVYIKMYNIVRSHNFTDEGYELAASVFKRKKSSVCRIVEKLNEVFNKE